MDSDYAKSIFGLCVDFFEFEEDAHHNLLAGTFFILQPTGKITD